MKSNPKLTRRHFIQGLTLAGITVGVGAKLSASQAIRKVPKAKNLILMVSDGMNNGTLSAANHWMKLTENKESEWMRLYTDSLAKRLLVETTCADSLVTDSAAASSAWGIGHRVNMGSINTMSDGSMPTPLAVLAKQHGKSVGMVSTARITHATPAGFAASVANRNMEDPIAVQYLERALDVLLGGGDKHFNPIARKDKRNLYADYAQAGYRVVTKRSTMQQLKHTKNPILGVFCKDHLPYCIDRTHKESLKQQIPSLEEMTQVALKHLSQNPEGFVLQVEAGRVDHAGHANDPATILFEQLEFDRTIGLVRAFAEKEGDTLVAVTTDHGTGGFMLNGADDGYRNAQKRFLKMGHCKGSFDSIEEQLDPVNKSENIAAVVEKTLSIQLEETERKVLQKALQTDKSQSLYHTSNAMANALHPILFKRFSVNWTSHNHTADLVEMALFGPGSNLLPGYIENWQLHHAFRKALQI